MVITACGLIVFHLVVWIGVEILVKSKGALDRKYGNDLLGFAYLAIPTRHTYNVDAGWAKNEEMVDWFAIQSPKIFKVYSELDIL